MNARIGGAKKARLPAHARIVASAAPTVKTASSSA
jgi:hypothetical protein